MARSLTMRELLLAYLFGQLDQHEREQVDRALAQRPRLREELRRLQECLEAEEQGEAASCEPPTDLVKRTCQRISQFVGQGGDELDFAGPRVGALTDAVRLSQVASPPSDSARNRCSLGELAAAVGITVMMAMLIIPAIHDSRMYARRDVCQDHLYQIYSAINAFAAANGGRIPFVPASGKDAFAGIFPVLLADGKFVDRQQMMEIAICPGTIRAGEWQQEGFLLRAFVPTHEQVMAASDRTLAVLRPRLAGSYAYRFGYIDEFGRYREWSLDYSRFSAILADAPSLTREGFQSDNHGGIGQNVLFADGHVEFILDCPELECRDHLFLNSDGDRAAPFGEVDAVLGRSEDNPRAERRGRFPF